ncbi:MAG: DNA-binding protein [Anaerolineaceae bacterium]|nr:DNA-binding protein [Anaerolineaceae bacterium]
MWVFDASSIIYGWDNYPPTQFPPLWDWMAIQIEANHLVIPRVAFEEVDGKIPECGRWLREHNLQQLPVNNAVIAEAMHIKRLLGIVGDSYHPKGVGENDIFIIATAKVHQSPLVSNEGMQNNLPNQLSKCKIPRVCLFPEVQVRCLNFIAFIKESEAIFG